MHKCSSSHLAAVVEFHADINYQHSSLVAMSDALFSAGTQHNASDLPSGKNIYKVWRLRVSDRSETFSLILRVGS